ncbi:universal stress protein [Ideonella azotifigens]|uniref:Universal stress protein n=1 Tax=Ideonella azotifigens TaxID=513160 RepID=A0ABP3VC59_9BURK|nr:universal stress protein [Ideonella azotifigens]MCD2344873.1 universal stress protein [Ideonella azotifigens]
MTYRSLLVHLDSDAQCAARTRLARRLAADLACHLVGLAPTGLIELQRVDYGGNLAGLAEMARDALCQEAEAVALRFRRDCEAAGLRSVETVVDEAHKAESIVRHAHCSDLAVLSQADPDAPGGPAQQDLVARVVLESARPTLLLPYAGHFETVAQRALVAWDDSAEAARALRDALPLLRRAERVQLVLWRRGTGLGQLSDESLKPVQRWLMWQGVTADVACLATELDIANATLSHAADTSADLIVMGAYGHARWSERLLGGATRGVLQTMTVPVLMSH